MINLFSPFREKLALDRDWGRRETGKVQTHRWCKVGLFVREGFTPHSEGCTFATTHKKHRKELPLSALFLGSFILLSRPGQGLLPYYCEMLKIYWKEIVLQNCWVMPKASRGEHDLQAPTEGHSWPACPEECFWFPMSDMQQTVLK